METETLAGASTRFALRLMSELRKRQPHQNVFISPLSVMLALAMTANGAEGATLRSMLNGLELPDATLDDLNTAMGRLLQDARGVAGVQLAIADALWGNQQVSFDQAFLQRCREVYQAEVAALDFGDPASVSRINAWVGQQTGGKIPTIVDSLNPLDVLVLINAIFFKGTWTTQFDPKITRPFPFNLRDGAKRPHPLMNLSSKFDYAEYDTFEVIRLPYGDGRVSMYILLPARASHPTDLLSQLDEPGWERALGGLMRREGMIALPRFKLAYSADLNEMLCAMGMAAAFSPEQADFSRMAARGHEFFIGLVRHKTFLEVNEEGTTAAGATAVTMRTLSISHGPPPFTMIVDRPFCCAIRDDATGVLLFLGAIVDPSA